MRVIPEDRDAYGAELKAYLRDGSRVETVERDDGYIEPFDGVPNYFASHKDWPPLEKVAIKLAHGRVLDVGCGAGRVALHLQGKGHKVIGIDNSPGAIRICRSRGVRDARLMDFGSIDATLGCIDTVVLFGNNFGLFSSFATARRVLRRLDGLCSPDATIIASVTDPYGTENPDHLSYHKRNRERDRMGGQLRLRVRHRRVIGPWFDYLLVSGRELKQILDGTNWRLAQVLRDNGPHYIAVLEKKFRNPATEATTSRKSARKRAGTKA